MDEHDKKIQQLLNSQTAENNALAIQLMMGIKQLSFEEAFDCLPFKEHRRDYYSIDIGKVSLHYFRDHHVMFDYIFIYRMLYYDGQKLYKYPQDFYGAEPYRGLSKEEVFQEEWDSILADKKKIAPTIKALFYQED